MTEALARGQSKAGAPDAAQARAFRALYQAQLPYVWRVLRRLGAREAEAEDLAHEVFVRVFQHLSEYDPARPVKPWLFGISFRVASENRRLARNRHESLEDEAPEEVDEAPGAVEHLARKEAQALVEAALDALSLEQRAVFVMHELEDEGAPEIARALGIPLNTVYSRLRKARRVFVASVRNLRAQRSEP